MEDKFFHIYADGKRTKEISQEDFRTWNQKYPDRQVIAIEKGYFMIAQYDGMKYLTLSQLLDVLEKCDLTPFLR